MVRHCPCLCGIAEAGGQATGFTRPLVGQSRSRRRGEGLGALAVCGCGWVWVGVQRQSVHSEIQLLRSSGAAVAHGVRVIDCACRLVTSETRMQRWPAPFPRPTGKARMPEPQTPNTPPTRAFETVRLRLGGWKRRVGFPKPPRDGKGNPTETTVPPPTRPSRGTTKRNSSHPSTVQTLPIACPLKSSKLRWLWS